MILCSDLCLKYIRARGGLVQCTLYVTTRNSTFKLYSIERYIGAQQVPRGPDCFYVIAGKTNTRCWAGKESCPIATELQSQVKKRLAPNCPPTEISRELVWRWFPSWRNKNSWLNIFVFWQDSCEWNLFYFEVELQRCAINILTWSYIFCNIASMGVIADIVATDSVVAEPCETPQVLVREWYLKLGIGVRLARPLVSVDSGCAR